MFGNDIKVAMHIDGLVQDSLQYLQCISDGDTTVLQLAFDI